MPAAHLSLKSLCGGGVPFSHPSLGLSVFFLSFTLEMRRDAHRLTASLSSTSRCRRPQRQRDAGGTRHEERGGGFPRAIRGDRAGWHALRLNVGQNRVIWMNQIADAELSQ